MNIFKHKKTFKAPKASCNNSNQDESFETRIKNGLYNVNSEPFSQNDAVDQGRLMGC